MDIKQTGKFSLPLCHSSSELPSNRHSLHFKSVQQRDYDNLPQKKTKNCDNLHLYRVNETYYYRRNINKKSYRISLKTKDLKQSIKRKKFYDLLTDKELESMFRLEKDGIKLEFEYDKDEELLKYIEAIKPFMGQVKDTRTSYYPDFFELEPHFLNYKRESENVGNSSFRVYGTIFNKLQKFFDKKSVVDLKGKDIQDFQNYLKRQNLDNVTINNQMTYVKMILDFCVKREIVEKNPFSYISSLKETKKKKENYNDEEILKLINNKELEEQYINMFKIASYTGMRVSEIILLKKEDVKTDVKTNIKYYDLTRAKTECGIRKIPLHNEIKNIKIPIFKDRGINRKTKIERNDEAFVNYYDKKILEKLRKIIPKESGKNFHTLRGTFIQKLTNRFPEKINLIQEIIGHDKGSKSLTLDTYSKEFYIEHKKEIIDSVDYKI
ncbi:MAG: phage integrase SAM-like domain-containing protein [Candidatus Altimarinota bacterium]